MKLHQILSMLSSLANLTMVTPCMLFGIPDTEISKLQNIQNTAGLILTKTRKYDHISPILRNFHWLKRIDFKILVLAYQCLNNLAPTYVSELIRYEPSRNLKSSDQYNLKVRPHVTPSILLRCTFSYAAPVLWNRLPVSFKTATSLEYFKPNLKAHMFAAINQDNI